VDGYALKIGGYGATFKFYPGNGAALLGPTNDYNDVAEDFQLQYIGENHIVTVKGGHLPESITNNAGFNAANPAATNLKDSLTLNQLDARYYYKRKIGTSLGYFSTTCTSDRILYPNALGGLTLPSRTIPLGVTVSANSSPDTAGYVAELNYLPWLNVKMTLQYTHYTKFNGSAGPQHFPDLSGVGRAEGVVCAGPVGCRLSRRGPVPITTRAACSGVWLPSSTTPR
jgi:hypothetical protein